MSEGHIIWLPSGIRARVFQEKLGGKLTMEDANKKLVLLLVASRNLI
jgi:hypothetical protein